MSKSTMALIITWIVIAIAIATYLGYYFGKKNGQNQCQDKEESTIKTDNIPNPGIVPGNTIQTPSPGPSAPANEGQKPNSGTVNDKIIQ